MGRWKSGSKASSCKVGHCMYRQKDGWFGCQRLIQAEQSLIGKVELAFYQ